MSIPPSFAETNVDKLHDFIEQHSFGVLVNSGESQPVATHLPFLLERDHGPYGTLVSHMARANTHWQSIDGTRTLVMFHGPQAYISPTWYGAKNVVPTWNYVAVHAYGTVRLITDHDQLLDIVDRTVKTYESQQRTAWTLDDPDDNFIRQLLNAIIGFEIVIDDLQGKWKLSQNHESDRQRRVIDALRESGGEQQRSIADLMQATRPAT